MGSTVPKFGEWDEKDPSSADNFTGIFNKVREEKQGGSAKASIINDDARYLYGSNHDNRKESSVRELFTDSHTMKKLTSSCLRLASCKDSRLYK